MADPQLENGYVRIATELLEALAHHSIPSSPRQILDVILRKTYGYQKAKDAISTSQFIRFTGLSRGAVIQARRRLAQMRIIGVDNPGHSKPLIYSIQKDYHKWKGYPKMDTVYKSGHCVQPNPLGVDRSVKQGGTDLSHTKDNKNTIDNTKDKELSLEFLKTRYSEVKDSKEFWGSLLRDGYSQVEAQGLLEKAHIRI